MEKKSVEHLLPLQCRNLILHHLICLTRFYPHYCTKSIVEKAKEGNTQQEFYE